MFPHQYSSESVVVICSKLHNDALDDPDMLTLKIRNNATDFTYLLQRNKKNDPLILILYL